MATRARRWMALDRPVFRSAVWIGTAVLAIATFYVAVTGSLPWAVALLLFLGIAFVLLFTERVPSLLKLAYVGAALFGALGWASGWYETVSAWDELAHFVMSLAATLVVGWLVLAAAPEVQTHGGLTIVAITAVGLAIGVAWEWFEYVVGSIGSLGDTLGDLAMDALGAFVAAVVSQNAFWASGGGVTLDEAATRQAPGSGPPRREPRPAPRARASR